MDFIKIDAENMKIEVIKANEENSLKVMQEHAAHGGFITQAVALDEHGTPTWAVDAPERNTVYVDDEGLFKDYKYGFIYHGAHQPFMGNGVIAGFDPETGDSQDVSLTVEQLKNRILFI